MVYEGTNACVGNAGGPVSSNTDDYISLAIATSSDYGDGTFDIAIDATDDVTSRNLRIATTTHTCTPTRRSGRGAPLNAGR